MYCSSCRTSIQLAFFWVMGHEQSCPQAAWHNAVCIVWWDKEERLDLKRTNRWKKSSVDSQKLTKLLPSPSQTMCCALFFWGWWYRWEQQQQLQAQHLSHGHGPPVPLTPHPSGLQPPGIPPLGSSAGLLALSSALGGQSHLAIKDDKKHHDAEHHRGERHGRPD